VQLTLKRGERERVVTVRTGRLTDNPREPCQPVVSPRPGKAKSCVGVTSQTIAREDFPVDIKIDTRAVSGPSAGLAFTLAIIDDLTEGSLTGGKLVAVTGSILNDGHVLPVGGIEQKTVAARQHGAKLMLVPKGEAAAAREHAGRMRVVAVDTIDDALAALRRAGGAPVPRRPEASRT
jgi:Lon-like protease